MDMSESTALLPATRPTLAYSPHPLSPSIGRRLVYADLLPGETVWGYLQRSGIADEIGRRPVICTINGARVPRELWMHCRPKRGTLVNLTAIVRGGGKSKNPLATLVQIGLMIGANMIFPGGGIAILQRGAISLLGGLVVNPLFPPPQPKIK
jgi:hypothetical protein